MSQIKAIDGKIETIFVQKLIFNKSCDRLKFVPCWPYNQVAGSALAPNAGARGGLKSQVAWIVRLGCLVEAMMRRLPTLCPRVEMELPLTDSAPRSRLDTSPLQFALDDIESYLKREHGERRPTDDRGSRQDQKRRHLNL